VDEPILRTQGLSRRFGGLHAAKDVAVSLHMGSVHALLGPNGAGKSTLINLLSGDLAASSGSIFYKGIDVTRTSADRRARDGIGRSYQKTNLFASFTAYENCRLAAQSRAPRVVHVLASAQSHAPTNALALRALAAAGLAERADTVASAMSHGEQRQLEIATVLATQPEVLLLDEPLAGMGPDEAQRMIALLRQLRTGHAILLVEHDMDAVFALADCITVMVDGRVLECGPPAQIRASAAVREAYLGAGVE
jgi:branched-chain amino acid transport system ATP-binding protein